MDFLGRVESYDGLTQDTIGVVRLTPPTVTWPASCSTFYRLERVSPAD
jgi:hypothetical protein